MLNITNNYFKGSNSYLPKYNLVGTPKKNFISPNPLFQSLPHPLFQHWNRTKNHSYGRIENRTFSFKAETSKEVFQKVFYPDDLPRVTLVKDTNFSKEKFVELCKKIKESNKLIHLTFQNISVEGLTYNELIEDILDAVEGKPLEQLGIIYNRMDNIQGIKIIDAMKRGKLSSIRTLNLMGNLFTVTVGLDLTCSLNSHFPRVIVISNNLMDSHQIHILSSTANQSKLSFKTNTTIIW